MILVSVGGRIPYINKSTKPTKGFGTETIPTVGGLHHSFVFSGRFPRQIQVPKDGGWSGGQGQITEWIDVPMPYHTHIIYIMYIYLRLNYIY